MFPTAKVYISIATLTLHYRFQILIGPAIPSVYSHFNLNQMFLDFLQDNTLYQLVNYSNRGSKILDVFITNRPSLVELCKTIDGIGDHEAVLVSSYFLAPTGHPVERSIYLWSQSNFDEIRQKNEISM